MALLEDVDLSAAADSGQGIHVTVIVSIIVTTIVVFCLIISFGVGFDYCRKVQMRNKWRSGFHFGHGGARRLPCFQKNNGRNDVANNRNIYVTHSRPQHNFGVNTMPSMEHYMEVWAKMALQTSGQMELISNLISDLAAYGYHIGPGPGWPAERLLLHPPQVHGDSPGVLFAHGGPRVADDDVDSDEAPDAARKRNPLPQFEFRRKHAAVHAGAAAAHRLRRQHAAHLHGGGEPTRHASPAKSDSGGKFKPSAAAASSAAGERPIPADSDPHPDGEDHGR